MKRLCLLLLLSSTAFGQGVILPPQQALKVVNGITSPVANATITVCAANIGGIPCAPPLVSALFKDAALTQPLSNPFTTDANGNYSFAMASGTYTVTVSAPTFVGYSYQITVPLAAGANLSFTGSTTFSGPANLNGGGSLIGTFGGPATFNGSNTFTGNNIFTGTNTFAILGNVLYVGGAITNWAGADIGAQINSAYAALPSDGGRIRVVRKSDGSCYPFTTPIVFQTVGKFVILEGEGVASVTGSSTDGNACLNYTPTSGTAITLDVAPTTGGRAPGAGLRDISLVNNNCLTAGGCGGTAIGLALGGTNGGVLAGQFQNVQFRGFNTGVSINDSLLVGWGLNFVNDVFVDNATGVKYTVTGHENDVFRDGKFTSNNIGMDLGTGSNVEASINNSSFDGNLTNAVKVSTGTLHVISGHWENPTCPNTNDLYINQTGAGIVDIVGGQMLEDCTSGTATQLIVANGFMTINNLQVFSGGRTITNLITNTSGIVNVEYVTSSPASISGTCSVPTACMWLEIQTPVTSMALKFGSTTSIGRDTVTLPNTSFTAITSATGLQIFNTTTTCTTGASVGATCTTAAISLPVAEADTNYRITCTGKGPTAVPVVSSIANSSATQFTITIAALTAVAASFTSFDCIAGHN